MKRTLVYLLLDVKSGLSILIDGSEHACTEHTVIVLDPVTAYHASRFREVKNWKKLFWHDNNFSFVVAP